MTNPRRLLKNKRNFKKNIARIFFLLFLISLFFTLFLFLRSDFFRLQKVDCFLEGRRCPSEIWLTLYSLTADKSALSFSPGFLEKEIKERYFQILTVKAQIKLPQVLVVNLTQRNPLLVLSLPDQAWLIDQEGIILGRPDQDSRLPQIVAPAPASPIFPGTNLDQTPYFSLFHLGRLLLQKQILFQKGESTAAQATITASDWQALFSLQKELAPQVDSLQLILSKAKIEGEIPRVIDLRFEKPIITNPEATSSATEELPQEETD